MLSSSLVLKLLVNCEVYSGRCCILSQHPVSASFGEHNLFSSQCFYWNPTISGLHFNPFLVGLDFTVNFSIEVLVDIVFLGPLTTALAISRLPRPTWPILSCLHNFIAVVLNSFLASGSSGRRSRDPASVFLSGT